MVYYINLPKSLAEIPEYRVLKSMISFSGLDFALCNVQTFSHTFLHFPINCVTARKVISIFAFVLIFLMRILLQLVCGIHTVDGM